MKLTFPRLVCFSNFLGSFLLPCGETAMFSNKIPQLKGFKHLPKQAVTCLQICTLKNSNKKVQLFASFVFFDQDFPWSKENRAWSVLQHFAASWFQNWKKSAKAGLVRKLSFPAWKRPKKTSIKKTEEKEKLWRKKPFENSCCIYVTTQLSSWLLLWGKKWLNCMRKEKR